MRCRGRGTEGGGTRLEDSRPPYAATRHGTRGPAGRTTRDASPRAAPRLAAPLAAPLERIAVEAGARLLFTCWLAAFQEATPLLAPLLARHATRTADGPSPVPRRPGLDGGAAPGRARARGGQERAAAGGPHCQHRARHAGRHHDRLQRVHVWRCNLNIGRRSLQPARAPRSPHTSPHALLASRCPSEPPLSCCLL